MLDTQYVNTVSFHAFALSEQIFEVPATDAFNQIKQSGRLYRCSNVFPAYLIVSCSVNF